MKVNRLKRNASGYPASLKEIADPPKELFIGGASIDSWVDKPKVAIVGSRKVTPYGRAVTSKLAGDLARQGGVIISGLALGVDSLAHLAALEVGGLSVAVLPGGLDKIYPASHLNLARRITEQGGSLISEYPAGSEIYKHNFIARNRIVSGLSDVLVITEAAANSGSLHTASFALDQGKTVMAVPGNINAPSSVGANSLIKSGALAITEVEDIFFALGLKPNEKSDRVIFKGTKEEEAVLDLIQKGVSEQEEIATRLRLAAPKLAFILTYLEINGHIRPKGNGKWQLA